MVEVTNDLRIAMRRARRTPVATATAVVSLALGVCVTTVVFSALSAVLLRPLPGTAPGLLRVLGEGSDGEMVMSFPEFAAVREARIFEGVAAERVNQASVSVDGIPRSVGAAAVSSDYFELLGVRMAMGRSLAGSTADEPPIVVISDRFRRTALAGAPDPLGRKVTIGGLEATVVGVAASDFSGGFPGFRSDLWVALDHVERVFPRDGSRSAIEDRFLNVLGRAGDGIEASALGARLFGVAADLGRDPSFPPGRTFRVEAARGGHPAIRGALGAVLAGMLLVAATVLLVAVANVSSVLLARAVTRAPEIAVRSAIGATPTRLAGLFVWEGLLLGLGGGAIGLTAARGVTAALSRVVVPLDAPIGLDLGLDAHTLAFGLGSATASGLAFGLVAALRGASVHRGRALRAASVHGDRSTRWLQRILVAGQLALTTALLLSGAALVRGMSRLAEADPGFDRERIVTVETSAAAPMSESEGRVFWDAAVERLEGIPGVESAALGLFVHLGGRSDRLRLRDPSDGTGSWPLGAVHYSIVDPGFFAALRIEVLEGSGFSATGSATGEVVVNETLAERLWPSGNALGREVEIEDRDGSMRRARVVAVVETARYRALGEDPTPFVYLPLSAWYRPDLVVHLRLGAGVGAAPVVEAARERLGALDRGHPAVARPMSEHVTVAVTVAEGLRRLLLVCGLLGLAIACVGVYGVVSYVNERRSSELAVRMALGSTGRRLVLGALVDAAKVALVAVGAGLLGGRLLTSLSASVLPGLGQIDPIAYLTVAVVVAVPALLAAWIPARRTTTRVDVLEALRP